MWELLTGTDLNPVIPLVYEEVAWDSKTQALLSSNFNLLGDSRPPDRGFGPELTFHKPLVTFVKAL